MREKALKSCKDGEVIFRENDIGNEMYIIRSGKVRILRERDGKEIVLATLKEGDFFGEMAIFSGLPRSASAQSVGETQLEMLSKDSFKKCIKEPVIWRILEKMSQRLRETDEKLQDLLIEDELRKVMQLFRRYVAPKVVDEILKTAAQGELDLSGELREVTVLFADIRNFTSIAEKLQPQRVVELLNTYLGEMTHVVFRYDGTVDKYIGDAVMAVFNAPIQQKDHALLAVNAAFQIQKTVEELKEKEPYISVGIGINTGPAVLGNIGTDLHLDYTVIGDAVNIASRLCRVAAPGQLLISAGTYAKVNKAVVVEKLEPRLLKGKSKPMEIYNVVGLKSNKNKKGGEDARGARGYQKVS